MKILYLPLKAKWYEMIEQGCKREEYRETIPYWYSRLTRCASLLCPKGVGCKSCPYFHPKDFDAVCFSYGYTKRRMLWECKGITIGQGRPDWGAPDYETFIIKLGKRL